MADPVIEYNHEMDATILLTGFAAVVTVIMTQGTFSLWDSMIGITLLTALIISSKDIPRNVNMILVARLLMGLCIVLITGVGIDAIIYSLNWAGVEIFSIRDVSCREDSTVDCFYNHGMTLRDFTFFFVWLGYSFFFRNILGKKTS